MKESVRDIDIEVLRCEETGRGGWLEEVNRLIKFLTCNIIGNICG